MGSPADMEIVVLKIRSTGCHLFILSLCHWDCRMEEAANLRGKYTTAVESKKKYEQNSRDFWECIL